MRISAWSSDVCSSDLGNPHFSEGLFAVDQWNYILGLPSATGSGLLSCQYQVQFDKQHKVKATYWNTDECSAAAAAPDDVAATGSAVPAEYGPIGEIQTWSEDGLFTFGRSGLGDLDASGRKDLEHLAEPAPKQERRGKNKK